MRLHCFLLIAQRDRICWTPGGRGRSGARAAGYEGMQLKNALSSNCQVAARAWGKSSLWFPLYPGGEGQWAATPGLSLPKGHSRSTTPPPLDCLERAFWGRAWESTFGLAAALPVIGQQRHTLSVHPAYRLNSLSNKRHKTKTQPGKELNASRGVETMKKILKRFIRPLGADNTAKPSWHCGQLPELELMVMLKWSKTEKSLFGESPPCFFQRVDGQGLR